MAVFFIFSDTARFGIVRKDKKHRHSGESRNLFARKRKRRGFPLSREWYIGEAGMKVRRLSPPAFARRGLF
ncbi:MAG: hypothetical protein ACR2QC_02520 [Gammaproteobacteria bacterium]